MGANRKREEEEEEEGEDKEGETEGRGGWRRGGREPSPDRCGSDKHIRPFDLSCIVSSLIWERLPDGRALGGGPSARSFSRLDYLQAGAKGGFFVT